MARHVYFVCSPKGTSSSHLMSSLGVSQSTSSFCSSPPPPSPSTFPLVVQIRNRSYPWKRSADRRTVWPKADEAQTTGCEPKKTDSKTCIDVSKTRLPLVSICPQRRCPAQSRDSVCSLCRDLWKGDHSEQGYSATCWKHYWKHSLVTTSLIIFAFTLHLIEKAKDVGGACCCFP